VSRPDSGLGGGGRAALPGGAAPERRLAVTPSARRHPGARRAWRGQWRGQWRAPLASFPLGAPTWPGTVERPAPPRRLGTDYDTEWARRYPARLARVLVTELVTRPAIAVVAHPVVDGLDRVAHLHEPVIFAANHASHLDTPLLLSVLPERWRHRTVVAAGADYFFDTRVKAATFALTIGASPSERQRVSRDSADRAAVLLAEGWSLVIFPEGGRSPDGWAQPHRAGWARLAERSGRAVVPVHVEGTRHILPRGGRRPHPGTTRVNFGRPIRPDGDVRALAERIEAAIASLGDEATTDWWTARRRAAARTTPTPTGPDGAPWRRSWALGQRPRRRASDTGRWPDR